MIWCGQGNSISATTQTNTKYNLYIKDCIRADNVELRFSATFEQTQNAIFTLKIAFSNPVVWNLLQGDSKNNSTLYSKKLWFTKSLNKHSNQTQNAIFTLKIAFSSRVNQCVTKTSNHINSLPHEHRWIPKKNHPPTSLSAFRLVL